MKLRDLAVAFPFLAEVRHREEMGCWGTDPGEIRRLRHAADLEGEAHRGIKRGELDKAVALLDEAELSYFVLDDWMEMTF